MWDWLRLDLCELALLQEKGNSCLGVKQVFFCKRELGDGTENYECFIDWLEKLGMLLGSVENAEKL